MKQNTLFDVGEPEIEPVDPHVDESEVDRLKGQNATVRDLLKMCGMVKNSVAIRYHNITRLAARIKDLRAAGMNISTKRLGGDTVYIWEDYDECKRII